MLSVFALLPHSWGDIAKISFDYKSATSVSEILELDPCFPDPCSGQGFCNSISENSYECNCLSSFWGEACTMELESSVISELDCNGHGSYVVSNDLTASCQCDYGWSEASNCQEFVGCNEVDCGENGDCTMVDELTGEVTCECSAGWTGDFCATSMTLCTEAHLNKVVEDLKEIDDSAALDCSYIAPWTIFLTPGLVICSCLNSIATNMGKDYLESLDCLVDWYDDVQTPFSAWSNYCNDCSIKDLQAMEDVIMDNSVRCQYFITDRVSKPLYERMGLKCGCMESLGETYEAAAEYVSCPFTNHMISSDMVSWDNCEAESTCDFPQIYFKITSELAKVNKKAASVCQASLASLFMEYPDDLKYSKFGPIECECWNFMHQYCPECLEWLACNPVTFHLTYISDEFDRVCYDQLSAARECLWIVSYVASKITIAGHTMEGRLCYEAFRYGAALGKMDDTLQGMVCDCYTAGNDAGVDFEQMLAQGTPSMRWETCGAMVEDNGFQWSACNYTHGNKLEKKTHFPGGAGGSEYHDEQEHFEGGENPDLEFSDLSVAEITSDNKLSPAGTAIVVFISIAVMSSVGTGSYFLGKRAANIHNELAGEEQRSSDPIYTSEEYYYDVIDVHRRTQVGSQNRGVLR